MPLAHKLSEEGHVLLGALFVILMLVLLSVTLLHLAGQEALHRRLVGRVEHRTARAAAPGDLVPQL